jgi:RND family efflux transporter MFP subunit
MNETGHVRARDVPEAPRPATHGCTAKSGVRTMLSVVAPAGLAVLLTGCGSARSNEAVEPDLRPVVSVVTVAPVADAGVVRASGLVGYKRETQLSFNAPGVISALSVDTGDVVRAGAALASMRRVSVGSNPAEAAQARENAERLLARTRALFDKGFVSQTAVDDAELALERARDTVELTAPAAGVVLRRLAEPAQMVDAGTPVLLLGEAASGMVVRVPVAARAAGRLVVGSAASVRVDGRDARPGSVLRIAPKSDEATGAFEVEIRPDDAAGLRSGQVAEVDIAVVQEETVDSALLVPTLALFDGRADQGVVFVVETGDVARRRAVQTAGLLHDGVVVVAGLAAGERVVAAGAAYVRDGEPVRVAEPLRIAESG